MLANVSTATDVWVEEQMWLFDLDARWRLWVVGWKGDFHYESFCVERGFILAYGRFTCATTSTSQTFPSGERLMTFQEFFWSSGLSMAILYSLLRRLWPKGVMEPST